MSARLPLVGFSVKFDTFDFCENRSKIGRKYRALTWRVKCISYCWYSIWGNNKQNAFLRFHGNRSNIHWIVDSETCTSTVLRERVFFISIALMATRTRRLVTLDLHCLSSSVIYTGVCEDLPYAGWDFPNICIPELVYEEERHAFWASMVVVGGRCPSVFFISANAEWVSLTFASKRRAINCHPALL